MTTVFIAGSIAISRLHPAVGARIAKVVESGLDIVVGDADGVDASTQAALLDLGASRVTVYCSGEAARNNLGGWPVNHVYPSVAPGTRAYFAAKDIEMADAADYGLMIWDAKSVGTLGNVVELLGAGKKTVVFVNRDKQFATVSDVDGLALLVERMSDAARVKAEAKMGLSRRIAALRNEQLALTL